MSGKEGVFVEGVSGLEAVPHIRARYPRVFGCLVRSHNGNVVVMEGLVSANELTGIEFFWLDLEPEYRARARRDGKTHDRDEFSTLDHYAYGFSAVRVSPNHFKVTLKQLPDHTLDVKYEPRLQQVRAYYRDRYCLQYIKVQTTPRWPLYPSVQKVEALMLDQHRRSHVLTLFQA